MADQEMEFADTKLCALYYYELFWMSVSIVNKCSKIFEMAIVPERGYSIQINPEIHSLIASVLSDATNMKRLFVTQSVKLNGENGAKHKLRMARAREILQFLAPLKITEILNSKVRNTLEHFDEYLDDANYSLSKKPMGAGRAAYNVVISHWEVTDPRLFPIRLYVSSERKFYNMKWNVDIGLIFREAQSIVVLIKESGLMGQQDPGGVLVNI